jgi:hypothetical protein
MAPATLGIVCFRRHPAGIDDEGRLEELNAALAEGLAQSGVGLVSSTRLFGSYALRACILNHGTTQADVEEVLGWLETASIAPRGQVSRRPYARAADVGAGWPTRPGVDIEDLRAVPLLQDVEDGWLAWVGTVGRVRQLRAGETVMRQWDVDRDFYLLLSGAADVFGADGLLATMRAGDFFGELAALDWGASFGYPRLATVTARSDLRLLALTDAELNELMTAVPEVAARVRAVAGQRATRI